MSFDSTRREILRNSIAFGAAGLGVAGTMSLPLMGEPFPQPKKESGDKEPDVTATEDLMREHGVIRRALLVYTK